MKKQVIILLGMLVGLVCSLDAEKSLVCNRQITTDDFEGLASCHAQVSSLATKELRRLLVQYADEQGDSASLASFIKQLPQQIEWREQKINLMDMIGLLKDIKNAGVANTVGEAQKYLSRFSDWTGWHSEYGLQLEDDF